MKAIILAAGMGSRLGQLTRDAPKCLVRINGRTLLERQVETLGHYADEIIVVRGYCGDKIAIEGVRYVDNLLFRTTNMVGSLMAARNDFSGDCLVVYGDVLTEARVVEEAIASRCSVGVVVDMDFQEYWVSRVGAVTSDSESLQICEDKIIELGRPNPAPSDMHARYIGFLRFDDAGTRAFKRVYDLESKAQDGQRWYNSRSFQEACMTDMLQALIGHGVDVTAIPVRRGWLETDTESDVELYEGWIRSGEMKKYFDMPF